MSAAAPPSGAPLVSVVMPLFNAEAYVGAAVRSVLASELRELELLVIDDGSSDGSRAAVAAISDPRLQLITLPPSGGPSVPRNTGIGRARAPYVALVDADDLIRPHKLGAAVGVLDAHPEAGIAFADYERIDAAGSLRTASVRPEYPVLDALPCTALAEEWRLIAQPDFARGLLYENFIGTSGVVLRRRTLDRVGLFDQTLTYSEDRDLWFRIAHASAALYQARVGHSYRVLPSSLTYRPGDRQARHRIVALRRERERWAARPERRQVDRLIAENFYAIGYERRREGRRGAATGAFLRAFGRSPQWRFLRAALGAAVKPTLRVRPQR